MNKSIQFLQSHRGEKWKKIEKRFDYRGQIALVTLIVPYPTHGLLMGPSSMMHLLATYNQASIKAHHSSYRLSDS